MFWAELLKIVGWGPICPFKAFNGYGVPDCLPERRKARYGSFNGFVRVLAGYSEVLARTVSGGVKTWGNPFLFPRGACCPRRELLVPIGEPIVPKRGKKD